MKIVVGPTPSIGAQGPKFTKTNGFVEARILNVRPLRRRQGSPPSGQSERRTIKRQADPHSSRVMTILVPDGYNIPKDIDSGNYRIAVRFIRRKR